MSLLLLAAASPSTPDELVRAMFATGIPGSVGDPSDLTADKIAWRRNLAQSTGNFSDAYWLKSGSLGVAGTDVSPDGLGVWKTLTDANAAAEEYVYKGFTVVADASTHTESVHIKKTVGAVSSYPMLRLLFNGGTTVDCRVCINTTTGVVTSVLNATAAVADGGDYWRVSITGANNGTNNSATFYLYPSANTTGSTAIAPSATGSVVAWGAQFEKGALTPYQRITDFNSDFLAAYPHHTLFQDAAGTTPVTALGQPCGLVLDKRLGLVPGAELVTDGGFDTTDSWTANNATQSVVSGELELVSTGATDIRSTQAISCVVGRMYRITGTMRAASTNTTAKSCRIRIGTSEAAGIIAYVKEVSANGVATPINAVFLATSTTHYIHLNVASVAAWGVAGEKAYFDNISVRELPGNHAYQTSAPSRPTVEARVNQVLPSEGDYLTYTTRGGVDFTSTPISGFAGSVLVGDNSTVRYAYKNVPTTAGIRYRVSVFVVMDDGGAPVVSALNNTGDFCLVGDTTVITGALTVSLYGVDTNTGKNIYFVSGEYTDVDTDTTSFGIVKYATQSARTFRFTGLDVRPASESHYPYQRVTTATDYADVGAPRYLQADGTDDGMVTNSINFTGTDKVTVLVGIRKLSDADIGTVAEFSSNVANSDGVFLVRAPNTVGTQSLNFYSKGTALISANSQVFPSPITAVLTGIGDISGDSAILRVNGVQAASSSADQGTGNYGNYPLYLFRRGGSSLPFNGRCYGWVVYGAKATPAQLAALEAWANQRARAY